MDEEVSAVAAIPKSQPGLRQWVVHASPLTPFVLKANP